MSETREVKSWRQVYYVSRQLLETDSETLDRLREMSRKRLPKGFNVIGEPRVTVSQPLPQFEFGIDDDGNPYRRPDTVMVDFRGWQL